MAILSLFQNNYSKAQKPTTTNYPTQIERIDRVKSINKLSTKETVVITGTVVDENQGSLPGANVIVKGFPIGVVTDLDGKFKLELEHNNNEVLQLQVSFIGYETLVKHVELANYTSAPLHFEMEMDASVLGDVVVGGAISVKKWSPKWIWWRIKNLFR